jgi:hypothetical protein
MAASSVNAFTGADALQRFLHGLHDVGAAGELVVGEALDALDQLAQDQHRRRHHHEADERQHRILRHHHEDQADQQQPRRARPR